MEFLKKIPEAITGGISGQMNLVGILGRIPGGYPRRMPVGISERIFRESPGETSRGISCGVSGGISS